ncbi:BolA family transcriptional regulator [Aureimonas sp. AU12]|uniref:BolA family protein n=1 Tax=Aureimonas sp. AU12 TaxID=1638161 RepID=UPI000783AEEB|nr:BolA family protein [Aureimonas sp. AU12]
MTIQAEIEAKLTEALRPESLVVVNESHLHAGHHHGGSDHHGGFDGSGETHFRVRVVSAAFAERSRVERHRLVNTILKAELDGSVHALAIEASAPGEPTRR